LDDLYRVPAETKAAVMQIVEQTKRRSGWRVYRTLAALGVPRSVYYAWRSREDLQDRTAKPCRVYEVLPEERGAICEFALQYGLPLICVPKVPLETGRFSRAPRAPAAYPDDF
jgi:hypothetical protein